MKQHTTAVFQALFVVFLWATSWVFVKIGLKDIPPITFAGLRYFLAFLCLLTVLFFSETKKEISQLPKRAWVNFFLLGVLFYAGTQGAIFVALAYLPAVTVNLLWSFSSVVVALLGIFWLSENPTCTSVEWNSIGNCRRSDLFRSSFDPRKSIDWSHRCRYRYPGKCNFLHYGQGHQPVGKISSACCDRDQHGRRFDPLAPIRFHRRGNTCTQFEKLGNHTLAGVGQYSVCLYTLESYVTHTHRDGVKHHQRDHDDLDTDLCYSLFGRVHHRQGSRRAGDSYNRHTHCAIKNQRDFPELNKKGHSSL